MRELTQNEIDDVAGGFNDWQQAGATIFAVSLYSPVTMGIGFPIAFAVFGLGTYQALMSYH